MAVTRLGKYEVIREIGRGGMGVVYEARDPDIDRRVAINTIRIDAPPAEKLPLGPTDGAGFRI